jgi:trans-aconitate 2-methyltransferase
LTLEWDAAEYEVVSVPHVGWGVGLLGRALERRPLRGDEVAIDAGCGTGKITELLLRHLPDGTVLAVDASAAMVEAARKRFAGDGRVRVEQQDLVQLQVERPVELIFSTATFHWIQDHQRLFGRLARALKPGGRLVVQCGGKGNIARMMGAAEEVMDGERFREAAGFEEVETWLQDEVTRFGSRDELARFLKTVVLGRHLERLPESEHQPFADAVTEKAAAEEDALTIDYVRLNILANRGRES